MTIKPEKQIFHDKSYLQDMVYNDLINNKLLKKSISISIYKIKISKVMVNAIKIIQPDFNFNKYAVSNKRDVSILPLSVKKIKYYILGKKSLYYKPETTKLPPIIIKTIYSDICADYICLDGRHRVCRAILLGETVINAIIRY